MTRTTRTMSATALALLLAACGGGGGGPSITSVNPTSPNYSSLQFAVGTANLYGTSRGFNVVSTFRQTNGASATGVNTPTITGPFVINATVASSGGTGDPYSPVLPSPPPSAPLAPGMVIPGPALSDATAAHIGGTPQTVAPGTPACDGTGPPAIVVCKGGIPPNTSTFGEAGGVFAMGIAPYNHVAASGQAYSYQPYAQPLYDASAAPPGGHLSFVPWGGPPAFDPDGTGMGERDGVGAINGIDSLGNPFFLGVAEGITVFDGVKASVGSYTLSVAVSTVGSGGAVQTSSVTKSASLASTALLPTLTTPVVTPNGSGGATVAVTLPAGVLEAYVQIVDYGPGGGPAHGAARNAANCHGARGTAFAPVYYTLHVTASGTMSLPNAIGPNLATSGGISNLQPSHSLCSASDNAPSTPSGSTPAGDDIVVQMIGFDYPIYQAALGLTQATTPQNPPIANASGQANITISPPMEQDGGSTTQVPLAMRHR